MSRLTDPHGFRRSLRGQAPRSGRFLVAGPLPLPPSIPEVLARPFPQRRRSYVPITLGVILPPPGQGKAKSEPA